MTGQAVYTTIYFDEWYSRGQTSACRMRLSRHRYNQAGATPGAGGVTARDTR